MGAQARKKIRDAIKELAQVGKYEVHSGKVLTVDESAATMSVEVLELTFYDVRLRAVVTDDTGLWVLPKVGSYVIIGQIEGGVDHVLLQPSEIDKVFVKIGGKTLFMDSIGQVFNGGDNGGLVKSESTANEINTLKIEINKLKTIITSIIAAAASPTTPVTNGTLAAYFTAPPYDITPLPPITPTDLENINVKH